MKNIEELEKIAVLIDADNTQLSRVKSILDDISTHGRIVVKKAYGDWKNPILKNWEDELNRLAIKPEQQFAYVTGKNATDITMVIDAIDLLHTGIYDAFVLVSSDSDFTPLAIRLRESGIYVFGVGEKHTPQSFRNACDDFTLTENLADATVEKEKSSKTSKGAKVPSDGEKADDIDEIHELLGLAYDIYQDEEGWANISAAGSYVKRVKPDFSPRTFGVKKLSDLLEKFPQHYKTKRSNKNISFSVLSDEEEDGSL